MKTLVLAAAALLAIVNAAAGAGSQSGPMQPGKERGQPVVPGIKGDKRQIGTTSDRIDRVEHPRNEENPVRSESTGRAPPASPPRK